MALNLKNADVERLAAEVARLTGESKTEAIRRALEERRQRLRGETSAQRKARVLRLLKSDIWPAIPKGQLRRRLTRDEEDAILGYRTGGRVTIDTSALIAILFSEPGYLDLIDRILDADAVRVGAPTLAETSLVFTGRIGRRSRDEVVNLVHELGVTIVPFGEAEWLAAADAFAKYGRGRHKAALNFGDCLAYATAAVARDSLLFVGEDFRHTDLQPA